MKKVTVIILVIIVFFLLGIILSDTVMSGVNKIFKSKTEESEVKPPPSDKPTEPPEKPRAKLKGMLSPREDGATKPLIVHNHGNQRKDYYYIGVIFKKREGENKYDIYHLDPELIVDPPDGIGPASAEIEIKIQLLDSGEVKYDWISSAGPQQNHVKEGYRVWFTCWQVNDDLTDREQIKKDFFILFLADQFETPFTQ